MVIMAAESILYKVSGFPRALENPGNNKFIFQLLEMSWNFNKIRKCAGKNIAYEKNPLRTKSLRINIMPVEENFHCRRKVYQYIDLLVKI